MKVLEISSMINEWNQLTDNFTLPSKEGEKQGFLLLPDHPILKSLFQISAEIHITSLDTDFILDIKISSITQFDTSNKPPTIYDLYDAYCVTKNDWNNKILEEANKRNLNLKLLGIPTPIEQIQEYLKETIRIAYNLN